MLEKSIIEYCSPTLASLKSGSLFMYSCVGENLYKKIEDINISLEIKGVKVILLNEVKNKSLIYVYRENFLEKELCSNKIELFLKTCGYKNSDINSMINVLKEKIKKNNTFPHEIGLFLGYPFEDVLGFIENKGKNCKCNGCWKVYYNVSQAELLFKKYKKCQNIYRNMWEQGKSITQLTVSV